MPARQGGYAYDTYRKTSGGQKLILTWFDAVALAAATASYI